MYLSSRENTIVAMTKGLSACHHQHIFWVMGLQLGLGVAVRVRVLLGQLPCARAFHAIVNSETGQGPCRAARGRGMLWKGHTGTPPALWEGHAGTPPARPPACSCDHGVPVHGTEAAAPMSPRSCVSICISPPISPPIALTQTPIITPNPNPNPNTYGFEPRDQGHLRQILTLIRIRPH